jgi:CheY-like chemotaxis protein
MLSRLPSQPEIRTATSGARAISLLESEPFSLLISDLNMPRMDGLQVLTIVRRRFPGLRTAVMTSLQDPQFRARAYALGIDLFLEKPGNSQEINFFMDCIESLLGREDDTGFRGVQSKSLMDIIQLECLSQSTTVLKVNHGPIVGKIWFDKGDVIDAEAPELTGEAAFRKILSWKTGTFEILPPDPNRPRAIFTSAQGLLLDSAQALDEARAASTGGEALAGPTERGAAEQSPLARLGRINGVEYVVAVPAGGGKFEAWGAQNPELHAQWLRQTMKGLRAIGEGLNAGDLTRLEGFGPEGHLAILPRSGVDLCIGFHRSLTQELVRETSEKVAAAWAS